MIHQVYLSSSIDFQDFVAMLTVRSSTLRIFYKMIPNPVHFQVRILGSLRKIKIITLYFRAFPPIGLIFDRQEQCCTISSPNFEMQTSILELGMQKQHLKKSNIRWFIKEYSTNIRNHQIFDKSNIRVPKYSILFDVRIFVGTTNHLSGILFTFS